MNNFKYLCVLSGAVVSIAGLASCSSDKKSAGSTWQLAASPTIEHAGKELIKFNAAESDLSSYQMSDKLLFPSASGADSNVNLTVTTDCTKETLRIPKHIVHTPLKSEFYMYEFLPPAAIFDRVNPLNDTVNCQINFVAENPNHSTHSFQIHNSPFLADKSMPLLMLTRNKEIVKSEDHQLIRVKQNELKEYTVENSRDDISNYQLECESLTAEEKGVRGRLNLNDLNFIAREKNQIRIDHSDICQLFSLEPGGKVRSFTDRFAFERRETTLSVQRISPITSKFVMALPFAEYSFTNNGKESIAVVVPLNGENSMQITPVIALGSPPTNYGQKLTAGLTIAAETADSKLLNGTLRFGLKPGETISVNIRFDQRGIHCDPGSNFTLFGFYYAPKSEKALAAYVLDEIDAALDQIHIQSRVEIEPYFQRWANLPTSISDLSSNKLIAGPKIDAFTNNICILRN